MQLKWLKIIIWEETEKWTTKKGNKIEKKKQGRDDGGN